MGIVWFRCVNTSETDSFSILSFMHLRWSGYVTTFVSAANIIAITIARLPIESVSLLNYSTLNAHLNSMPESTQATPSGMRAQHAARQKAQSCIQIEVNELPAPGDATREVTILRSIWTKSDRRRPRRSVAADRFSAANAAPPGSARRRPDQRQRDCHRDAALARR